MTDRGSIKTARISVESALVLYRKKLKLISLVSFIIGAIGLAAYVALSTVWDLKFDESPSWIEAFLVFAVPFTVGLIFFITIMRSDRRAALDNLSSACEFFADCFIYCWESTDGRMQSIKLSYTDATLRKENEKYGYIYAYKSVTVLAFSKEDLIGAELNTVRKLFGVCLPENAETVGLENYKEENGNELS